VIPVIDLSLFVDGDDDQRRAVGAQIDEACRSVGFFTIVGHGVDPQLIERLCRAARAFFNAPLDDRLAVAMPEPGYPYGYNWLEAEALNRSIGGAQPADLKETFNIGPIDPPPRPLDEMTDLDERAVYAQNLWPSTVADLRPAAEEYYRTMAALSATLMQAFAVALGLDPVTFEQFIDEHGSALRLAHYPAAESAAGGQFRAGAHTDYGTLTILWTDGVPGLQVLSPAGSWIDVEAIDGGLTVNLGDLMQRWTNDRWRSTMHRVVLVNGAGPRLSIPFFHNANWDAQIECIVADGEAPRHAPTTAGHHLMEKFRSTVI
jgi:isopenicillin N synthase-like dioxygenase